LPGRLLAEASAQAGQSPKQKRRWYYIGGGGVGRMCEVPYMHGLPTSERSIATAQ